MFGSEYGSVSSAFSLTALQIPVAFHMTVNKLFDYRDKILKTSANGQTWDDAKYAQLSYRVDARNWLDVNFARAKLFEHPQSNKRRKM